MTWKARLIDPAELQATFDLLAVAFALGPTAPDDYRTQASLIAEADRTFVVEDGDVIAGTAAALSLHVALPGGTVPLTGVSAVGVLPTHRRRGILRTLMAAVHEQALERGEPLAGLTASEAVIYRRFGYGVATRFKSLAIDRSRATPVALPAAVARRDEPGVVRLASEAEAGLVFPAVWERSWRRVAGEVGRNARWWDMLALDPEHDRGGASARFVAVHDDAAGVADGFAIYRIKPGWGSGAALPHELRVESLVGGDDAVEAALVRYLLDVDLVGRVVWEAAPLDLPLRWRVADSRAVQVTREQDHLWLRPLDVAACLASRTYAAEGACVVEVIDEARPSAGGRFRLDAGTDGADCRPTADDPDLVLGVPELGSLLLGGVSWSTLHRAGLIEERAGGAIARADSLFRVDRAPFCGTDF